jgi:hypothetical protein
MWRNLKPAAVREGDEQRRWRLAVVIDHPCAEHAKIPVFQRDGIHGGNGNVFDGNVHLSADYAGDAGFQNEILPAPRARPHNRKIEDEKEDDENDLSDRLRFNFQFTRRRTCVYHPPATL